MTVYKSFYASETYIEIEATYFHVKEQECLSVIYRNKNSIYFVHSYMNIFV